MAHFPNESLSSHSMACTKLSQSSESCGNSEESDGGQSSLLAGWWAGREDAHGEHYCARAGAARTVRPRLHLAEHPYRRIHPFLPRSSASVWCASYYCGSAAVSPRGGRPDGEKILVEDSTDDALGQSAPRKLVCTWLNIPTEGSAHFSLVPVLL
eukprot:COSAG02_NODE_627_length_19327_cov_4.448382_5_plen_155_part_00